MNKTEKYLYEYVEKCLKKHKFNYEKNKEYFYVNTKFGLWRICPEHENRSKLVTIFTRFDNPEYINKEIFENFRYNHFSGKLNFHYFNKDKDIMLEKFNYLCDIISMN